MTVADEHQGQAKREQVVAQLDPRLVDGLARSGVPRFVPAARAELHTWLTDPGPADHHRPVYGRRVGGHRLGEADRAAARP